MGLATELSYRHRPANALQRSVQRVASTRPGAWSFARALPPLDRLVHRLADGRSSLPEVLAGLPVLMVTTTGRRSGQPRTTPLISVPVGDDLALLGTNFGQPHTPAWVFNLEADPTATVAYRGTERRVRARPATDTERAEVWRRSAGVYGGYERYRERIEGRTIRIFVLETADDATDPTG